MHNTNNTKVEILSHVTGQDGDGECHCFLRNIAMRGAYPDGYGIISAGTVDVMGCGATQAEAKSSAAVLLRALAENLDKVQMKLLATADDLAPATADEQTPEQVAVAEFSQSALARSIAEAQAQRAERMERWADDIRTWAGTELVKAAAAGQAKLMLALPGDDAVAVVLAVLEQNNIRYLDVHDTATADLRGIAGVGYPVFMNGPYNAEGTHLNTRKIVVHIDGIHAAQGT